MTKLHVLVCQNSSDLRPTVDQNVRSTPNVILPRVAFVRGVWTHASECADKTLSVEL